MTAEIDRTTVLRPARICTAIVTVVSSVPCPFLRNRAMGYFRERCTKTEEGQGSRDLGWEGVGGGRRIKKNGERVEGNGRKKERQGRADPQNMQLATSDGGGAEKRGRGCEEGGDGSTGCSIKRGGTSLSASNDSDYANGST